MCVFRFWCLSNWIRCTFPGKAFHWCAIGGANACQIQWHHWKFIRTGGKHSIENDTWAKCYTITHASSNVICHRCRCVVFRLLWDATSLCHIYLLHIFHAECLQCTLIHTRTHKKMRKNTQSVRKYHKTNITKNRWILFFVHFFFFSFYQIKNWQLFSRLFVHRFIFYVTFCTQSNWKFKPD